MKTGEYYNPYMVFQGCIVPNCIMKRTDLTSTAKLCFGRLSQYAGSDGQCFPSLKQLSEELGVRETTIEKVIKDLILANLITKESPKGIQKLMHFRNMYRFVWNESLLERPDFREQTPLKEGCEDVQNEGNKKENHKKENHKEKYISENDQPKEKMKTESYTDDFNLFWKTYPKPDNKKHSFKQWNKLGKNRPPISVIISAIENQIKWREEANGDFRPFWKNASTWLSHSCWDDELPVNVSNNSDPWEKP